MKKKMKFMFAGLLIMTAAFSANAQDKNRFWVGGSFGIDQTKPNTDSGETEKYYSIEPEFGYTFSDRWAAGLRFEIQQGDRSMKFNDGRVNESDVNGVSVAPFVRYTAITWKALSIFIDGSLFYATRKEGATRESEGTIINLSKNNSDQFGIYIDPGISCKLSDRVSLTGRVNLLSVSHGKNKTYAEDLYDSETEYTNDQHTTTSASLNSPFVISNFTVGFNFKF
jgi:hypothetical protein